MDIRNAKVAKETLKIGAAYCVAGEPSQLIYRGFRSSIVDDMILDENGDLQCLSGSSSKRFGTYIFVTTFGLVEEFESLESVELWE